MKLWLMGTSPQECCAQFMKSHYLVFAILLLKIGTFHAFFLCIARCLLGEQRTEIGPCHFGGALRYRDCCKAGYIFVCIVKVGLDISHFFHS